MDEAARAIERISRAAYSHGGGSGMPPIAGGSGGGDNGNMEQRLQRLEETMVTVRERLVAIETRLSNMPTKGEMSQAISEQTWKFVTWMTGICGVLVAAVYFIARAPV